MAWSVLFVRWPLAAAMKDKMLRSGQHRTTEHGIELRAGFQTLQSLARNKTGAQTARRLRPLARRALMTARPPRVRMRARKPSVRARLTLDGW